MAALGTKETVFNLQADPLTKEVELAQGASTGATEAVVLLVKSGADVDHQDQNGFTALHHAAFNNHFDVASFLTLAGTDQTLKNSEGQTAYDIAKAKGHDELAGTLGCILNSEEFQDEGSVGMRYMCAQNNPKHPQHNARLRQRLCENHLEKLAKDRGEEYWPEGNGDDGSDENDYIDGSDDGDEGGDGECDELEADAVVGENEEDDEEDT